MGRAIEENLLDTDYKHILNELKNKNITFKPRTLDYTIEKGKIIIEEAIVDVSNDGVFWYQIEMLPETDNDGETRKIENRFDDKIAVENVYTDVVRGREIKEWMESLFTEIKDKDNTRLGIYVIEEMFIELIIVEKLMKNNFVLRGFEIGSLEKEKNKKWFFIDEYDFKDYKDMPGFYNKELYQIYSIAKFEIYDKFKSEYNHKLIL